MIQSDEFSGPSDNTDDVQIFNQVEFRERMMDDPDLMREVIQAMIEDTPLQMNLLRQSFNSGDLQAAGRAGHKIKGGAANVCCNEFCRLALCVERAGKEADGIQLEQAITDLENSWQSLHLILTKFWHKLAE